MRVLAFSDLHAHHHPQFSIPDAVYGTNRMRHIIAVLDQIETYALEHNIKEIVDVGDSIHQRGSVNTGVFNIIRDRFKLMSERGLHLTMLAGNHNQANKSGSITSIHTFDEFATVIETFTIIHDVAYIPYSESKDAIINQFQVCRDKKIKHVFAHIPVAGSQLVAGHKSSSKYEIAISEIQPECFVGVYLGHYHTPQYLASNMLYIGNTLHRDKSDCGQQKRFIEVELGDTFNVTDVNTVYPEFVQLTLDSKSKLLKWITTYSEDKFYYLEVEEGLHVPVNDLSNVKIKTIPKKQLTEPRIKGLDNLNPIEVLNSYIKHKEISEKCAEYGKKILEQALKESTNV